MARNFLRTLIGDHARALQAAHGSRASYDRLTAGEAVPDTIGPAEAAFIAARDSFYLATRTAEGWPYIQHRGGPAGFLRCLDPQTLAFADFAGNRQYISAGNLAGDDRVALFLMDYPNRRRLKLIGHAAIDDDPALCATLADATGGATVERAVRIRVTGYDWNCPQHIVPRFSEAEVAAAVAPLHAEIAALRDEVARLRGAVG